MLPGTHGLYYSFPLSDSVGGQWFIDKPGPDGKSSRDRTSAAIGQRQAEGRATNGVRPSWPR